MTKKLAKLQEEYLRLVKLQKLSAAFLRAKSTKEIGSIIINEGFDALGSNCGDIAVMDERKSLRHIAHRGYPKEIANKFYKLAGKAPTMTMDVLQSGKPIFIPNFKKVNKKYSFGHKFIQLTHSRAAVLLPLIIRGKTFGCLQFTFQKVQKFPKSDKEFILYLADQCAQALDRMIALENEKRARSELDAILKNIDDAVIVRNVEGKIVYLNPKAVMLHRCKSAKELLNLSLGEYHNLFLKTLDENGNELSLSTVPFAKATQEKKHVKTIMYKVLKKTNEAFWLRTTSIPVLDKNNSIEFIVSVIADITEEKKRDNSKDEFFGIASHELKTPVTSLKAYAQVLEKRFEKEGNFEAANYLRKMDSQIDKLTSLIRDMLDVTKIEGGRLRFYNELFEFNALAEEIIEQIQLTTNHPIVLKKSKDAILFGDKERVGQVIINFLTNAAKYTPDKKRILAAVKKETKYLTFSVRDFGIGIGKEDQKHVFERFYRERNLKGDTFPGLGLGLYIASEVIKRLHGKIGVESEKGKGSTFYFQLPLAKKRIL